MGLTTAMYCGLSGLNANQARVETIGNNIANVNTTAFKGSRTLFQTQFAQTLSMGTPPSTTSGGTNPMQVGLGTMVGTTQRMLSDGALETTGLPSDMAIEGGGYFIVKTPGGSSYYTRDGSFVLNSKNELVSMDGNYLQGFGVDQDFNIVPGQLQNLQIPLGQMSIARATQNAVMDGDLSAADTIATQGSQSATQALVTGGGAAADAATALTDARSATAPGTALFATGDVITLSGATKGERTIPTQTFTVGTTGNTLGDLATWLQNAMGIQTGAGLPGNPGVTVEGGALVIRSDAGQPNAIQIQTNDLTSSDAAVALPFQFTQTGQATGSGVFTSFTVYDSLGNPVPVNATFTLDATPNTGPVWRFYLESGGGGTTTPISLGTGTVAFDTNGNYVSATGNQFAIDRGGTGAASPLTITLDLSKVNGLSADISSVIMSNQDGYPSGTLTNYSVGEDGTVTGAFTNGIARTLGQVALATFANDGGLVAERDNLFSVGSNSGPAAVLTPGSQGAGQVRSGALEASNVDLSNEFIGLITSSTGFQANSKVISTANDMLDQLMLALR
jgi:flagellar hook protein FlgE